MAVSPFANPQWLPKRQRPRGFRALGGPYARRRRRALKPVKPVKPVAPAKPTTPTPAPAPAARPVTPALPPDPRYESDIAGLRSERDETLGSLGSQRQRGLIDYGYTENPVTGALALDPNNAFAKAAQLKRNYDAQRRRTGLGLAAGGQLYAGAYQGAQDTVNRAQLGAQDALQRSLTEFLARNTGASERARTAYELGVGAADAARLERLPDNPLYEPIAAAEPKPAAKPKPKPTSRPTPGAEARAERHARRARRAEGEAERRARARRRRRDDLIGKFVRGKGKAGLGGLG